jgi:hypothetical protein
MAEWLVLSQFAQPIALQGNFSVIAIAPQTSWTTR